MGTIRLCSFVTKNSASDRLAAVFILQNMTSQHPSLLVVRSFSVVWLQQPSIQCHIILCPDSVAAPGPTFFIAAVRFL